MALFNQALLAAMRGGGMGGTGGARPGLAQQLTSNQTSLVGDRQLPTQGRTITPIQGVRGGFDVAYNGNSVGRLLRGGANGRFVGNGAPIPSVLSGVPGNSAGPMQLGGQPGTRIGGQQTMPPRQYAPNPFQQQMMQAQMLRRPIAQAAPPPMGGVGYDPNG